MINNLAGIKTFSFIASIISVVLFVAIIITDIRAKKASDQKELKRYGIIIRVSVYLFMIFVISIWRASNTVELPTAVTVFSGAAMIAATKTIFQTFPVLLFYYFFLFSKQKKD